MAVRAVALAAGLAAVTTQVQALSCMRPDIERSFNEWVDSEKRYYVGTGTLHPAGPLPEIERDLGVRQSSADLDYSAPYTFSGHLLGPDIRVPVTIPVTVRVACFGPWCGGFPEAGKERLMALEGEDVASLTLTMTPCPGSLFSAGVEARVNECLRAGRCLGQPEQ